jgi:hypothetical protein
MSVKMFAILFLSKNGFGFKELSVWQAIVVITNAINAYL